MKAFENGGAGEKTFLEKFSPPHKSIFTKLAASDADGASADVARN